MAHSINEGPFTHQAADTAYQFTKAALEAGFTSLMFDGSRKPLTQNIDETARIAELVLSMPQIRMIYLYLSPITVDKYMCFRMSCQLLRLQGPVPSQRRKASQQLPTEPPTFFSIRLRKLQANPHLELPRRPRVRYPLDDIRPLRPQNCQHGRLHFGRAFGANVGNFVPGSARWVNKF